VSSESTVLELVGLIYDAAEDPTRWPVFPSRAHLGCRCSGKPGSFAESR